jgi:dihydrofolate synthase/folylpolyglutamate synthase
MSRIAERITARLLALPKFGSGIGLHRMLALTEEMRTAGWWSDLEVLKVTGSNGKGSVARFCECILRELGFATGLYTSPHLVRFNERIALEGADITDDELAQAAGPALDAIEAYEEAFPGEKVGAFEGFTLAALNAFASARTQALVAEAGIGGRYDSTRILPGSVTVIASIDLEHAEVLGHTLEAIAYDKADLCPEGGTLITGPLDADLTRRLAAYAALRRLKLLRVGHDIGISAITYHDGVTHADFGLGEMVWEKQPLGLAGAHQAENAAAALLACKSWLAAAGYSVSDEIFRRATARALAQTTNPGRLETVARDPLVLLDVAHTPDAARRIADYIRAAYSGRRIVLLTGGSANKDIDGMQAALAPLADELICTRAAHRGAPAARVAEAAAKAGKAARLVEDDLKSAVAEAMALARQQNAVLLVAGGLFLALEARQVITGEPEGPLRFF